MGRVFDLGFGCQSDLSEQEEVIVNSHRLFQEGENAYLGGKESGLSMHKFSSVKFEFRN